MKLFLSLLQCLLLAAVLVLPAYAAEAEEELSPEGETETITTETEGNNITVNVTLPSLAAPAPEDTSSPEDPAEPAQDAQWQIVPYSTYSLDEPPVSKDTGSPTLAETVTALFGPYTPRTQTVTEYLSDGSSTAYTQVIPGLAGLDWPWLTAAGLFALFLYSLLRIVGGLLKL